MIACQSSNEEEQDPTLPEEDCFLDICVNAPDRPIVTRADEGEIKAIGDESKVNTLKIWVFRHSDAEAVGYLKADTTFLNQMGQKTYQLKLDKAFANNPEPVDVYVVANETLNEESTREDLNNAQISSFGIINNAPTATSVPESGLPMSAVLKNQPIFGKFPTLRIGTETEVATLQLTRAVSKLRFVMSREIDPEETDVNPKPVKIKSIVLNSGMIPTEAYLFLADDGKKFYIGEDYNNADINFPPGESSFDIAKNENPMKYAYQPGTNAQEYENLIASGIESEELTQVGPFYLHESDKKLTGVITYQATGEEEKTATFTMSDAGDFSRNHTWTVYAYYSGSRLEVVSVYVNKWTDYTLSERTIYNW